MRRHALGFVAILFLVCWATLMTVGPESSASRVIAGSAMRIGFVLGALWLALPQLVQIKARIPPWLLGTLAVGGFIIAVRPGLSLYVIVMFAVVSAIQGVGWLFKAP
jgi:hypothetical protein